MVPRGRDLLGRRVRDLRDPDGGLAAARRGAATRASLAHARASEGRGRAADRRALVGPAHAQHPRPLARPRASGRRVLRAIGGRIEAMATHESADLQAALSGDLGGIPFRTELSLKPGGWGRKGRTTLGAPVVGGVGRAYGYPLVVEPL